MNRTVTPFRPIIIFSTLIIALLIILQFFYTTASAATFTVTNTNDTGAGSLRQAISNTLTSPGPDQITFDPSLDGQIITLVSGPLVISGEVTIDASSLPNDITISGDNQFRVVYIEPNAVVNLNNLTISGGTTLTGFGSCESLCGGGIFASTDSNVMIQNSKILNNFGNSAGGILNDGFMTLSTTLVSGNHAAFDGGGIRTGGGAKMTITHSSILSNVTDMEYGGAGIFEENGELLIENSTVAYNQAIGNGGGLRSSGSRSIEIHQSTFSHNSATNKGGGLYIESSSGATNTTTALTFINSTISYNEAGYGGGGLDGSASLTTTVSLTLTQSTINNNIGSGIELTETVGGSVIALSQNSIIANSSKNNCVGISGDSYNLSDDNSCSGFTNGSPNFGPLADNGGETHTHALLANSKAFSLGDPATCQLYGSDQRGMSRPAAACDAGSGEFVDLFLFFQPLINR